MIVQSSHPLVAGTLDAPLAQGAQPVPAEAGVGVDLSEAHRAGGQPSQEALDLGVQSFHAEKIRHRKRPCQVSVPNPFGGRSPTLSNMTGRKPRPSAREALAANLRYLQGPGGEVITNRQLAKKAGVSPGTIDNMRDPSGPQPTISSLEAVARHWNLEVWQLLLPELPCILGSGTGLRDVVAGYLQTDDDGREAISRVARLSSPDRYLKPVK